jgi:general secretion pathway protein D
VFAITPRVIRSTDIDEQNQRAIDIGTSTTISLRHVAKAAAPAAAPAQSPASPAPSSQNPASPAAPAQPAPSANQLPANQAQAPSPGSSAPANFLFDPPTIQAAKGNTFAVNLLISGAQNVYSVPVQVNYNPAIVSLVNISNGGFLSQDGQAVALVHREDETVGQVTITATRPPGSGGVSGQGSVVTMTFQAKGNGQTPLTIQRGGARDPGQQPIVVNGAQASVTVQ